MTLNFGLTWLPVYLLSLATVRGLWSLGSSIVVNQNTDPQIIQKAQASTRTANKWLKASAIALISFVGGIHYERALQNRDRYTYTDVAVVARNGPQNFTLQPARMQPQEFDDLCDRENWQPNERLIKLVYSIKTLPNGSTCKDIERGGEWSRYTTNGKPTLFPQEILTDARY